MLFHNHTEHGQRYSYPLIQYKRIRGRAAIVCVGDGIKAISRLFTSGNFTYQTMFINLTNHPSDRWDDEQTAAARQFGDIEDMPFPDVRPDYSTDQVKLIATTLADVIAHRAQSEPTVVHVMGEMTCTFHLVAQLKARGLRCLASTTDRHAVMTPDGKKISDFKFIQFRDY